MGNVYISRDETASLEHYGHKGMKWYQHIFGEQDNRAAYNKKDNSNFSGNEGASRAYNKHNITEAFDAELREFIIRKNLKSSI